MRVVILAAGEGTRMRPITFQTPKPMIPILGKPHLELIFDELSKAGIDPSDIAVVVEYKKEQIIDYFKNHPKYSDVKIIEQRADKRGTGGATLVCRDFLGKDNFILFMGDSLFSLKTIKEFLKFDDSFVYIGAEEVPLDEARKYGVLKIDGDFVTESIEKPENPPSTLIGNGIYKLTPEIFESLDKVSPVIKNNRVEYHLPDVFNILAKEKRVKWKKADRIYDLGCPEDIGKAEKILIPK